MPSKGTTNDTKAQMPTIAHSFAGGGVPALDRLVEIVLDVGAYGFDAAAVEDNGCE